MAMNILPGSAYHYCNPIYHNNYKHWVTMYIETSSADETQSIVQFIYKLKSFFRIMVERHTDADIYNIHVVLGELDDAAWLKLKCDNAQIIERQTVFT